MKKVFLLIILLSSFAYSQTDCTSANISVYDAKGALFSTHTQSYKANTAAILLAQQQGKATVKTPDIVCTAKSASSSSARSSSVSSSIVSSRSSSSANGATVIYRNDFESGAVPSEQGTYFRSADGASLSVSTDRSLNAGGSVGSLRGQYPIAGGDGGYYLWGTVDVSQHNTRSICAEFDAKMPTGKQGAKFFKVFGAFSPETGHANATFGAEYGSGEMHQVSFGGGEAGGSGRIVNGVKTYTYGEENLYNDTHNVLFYNADYPTWVGRSYPTATRTPGVAAFNWDNNWHHFKMCVKFNSGSTRENEVADGAFRVVIDGKVYLDARNIFNRHHLNGPIDRVELFGWSQGGTVPFEIWFDNYTLTIENF